MSQRDTRMGLFYGIAAFVIWGLNPIYWKLLKTIPAYEILAHRAVWALIVVTILITTRREWPSVRAALAQPRILGMVVASSAFLGINWFIYVYAVNTDRILETSLGYYINPLLNVVLGMLFLKERLRRWQGVAVALAFLGVALMAYEFGRLPWISLGLALTFGFYGLLRKIGSLGSIIGFGFETAVMTLPALLAIGFWESQGTGHFTSLGSRSVLLLMGTGLITAVPLMCFARGVRSMPLSTMGLIQYLTPTCTFFLGIAVYKESFTSTHLVTFAMIWTALIIYTIEGYLSRRSSAQQLKTIDP